MGGFLSYTPNVNGSASANDNDIVNDNDNELDDCDGIDDSSIHDARLIIYMNDNSRTYTCPFCYKQLTLAALSTHAIKYHI
jgi:hypothetical protein